MMDQQRVNLDGFAHEDIDLGLVATLFAVARRLAAPRASVPQMKERS